MNALSTFVMSGNKSNNPEEATWSSDALRRFTNQYIPEKMSVRVPELKFLFSFAQLCCCRQCTPRDFPSGSLRDKTMEEAQRCETKVNPTPLPCKRCGVARHLLQSVTAEKRKDSISFTLLDIPDEPSAFWEKRIVHLAAFPGSGKTLILQQLRRYQELLTIDTDLFIQPVLPPWTFHKKMAQIVGLKSSSLEGKSSNREECDIFPDADASFNEQKTVLMVSCASKDWDSIFYKIVYHIKALLDEEKRNLSLRAEKPFSSKRKRPHEQPEKKQPTNHVADVDLRSLLREKLRQFRGLIILDEVDTIIGSDIKKRTSSSQEILDWIGSTRRRVKKTESCFPNNPATGSGLEFLIREVSNLGQAGSMGLVLVTNNVNIQPHMVIHPHLRSKLHTLLLGAYEKEDLKKILLDRCFPDTIFEPTALELLTTICSDVRRVLTVSLDAMLQVRRRTDLKPNQKKSNLEEKLFPSQPRAASTVSKNKTESHYPLLTVMDVAKSSSGHGDVTFRQLRTILQILSQDLQLALIGMIVLTREKHRIDNATTCAITLYDLQKWILGPGFQMTRLMDVMDPHCFLNALQSLTDFGLLKHNLPHPFIELVHKKDSRQPKRSFTHATVTTLESQPHWEDAGSTPSLGMLFLPRKTCSLYLPFDVRCLITVIRATLQNRPEAVSESGSIKKYTPRKSFLNFDSSCFAVFRATQRVWDERE